MSLPEGVVVIRGHLGWGNRKSGLDAYGPGGRWDPPPEVMAENARHGDLLGDALDRAGVSEGAELIVVAVPRSMLMADRAAGDKVEAIVRGDADG